MTHPAGIGKCSVMHDITSKLNTKFQINYKIQMSATKLT